MVHESKKINWLTHLNIEILSKEEVSKLIGKSDEFYVYLLWKMYENPPLPFYVGKGHYQRVLKHDVKSDEGNNAYKTNIIKKHTNEGLKIGFSIIEFFIDEYEALEKEKDIISLIGRADLEQGPLANKTDGGDGTLGHFALKGADNPAAREVVANDIEYGCLKDASNFLGIESSALMARIRKGWVGYYYKDEGQRELAEGVVGRYKKAVFIEGKEFKSLSEAGEKTGRDFRQIAKRIKYGWPDYYYIDEGQLPRKTIWGDREDRVPVIIRGIEYPTTADAVEKTGESRAMIEKRCLSSNFPDYTRKDGKIIIKKTAPKYPDEVSIESRVFKSLGEAAIFHNMSTGGVANRCRNKSQPDWFFTDTAKHENESFASRFSSNPISVEVNGVIYSSQSEAALISNVDISTLKTRCKSFSFPFWKCDSIKKVAPKDGRASLIGLMIDGVNYRSVNQASKSLKVHRSVIKRKLNSDDYPNYKKS